MTLDESITAMGTRRFDLLRMPDEDFESLCFRLIRLEFPEAFKPASTSDGGADAVLPAPEGGYARCWQAKHHPRQIHWGECKKSLATAIEHWNPQQYTFCFPRELTAREQKTFDNHFRGPHMRVLVAHWNGEELQARLRGSAEGTRVARTFFVDPDDLQMTYRAIEASGRLETPEDALDRMTNLGGFLASGDAFFHYPAATHEAKGPAPETTPGTVMSVLKTDGSIASRVDVVPRDADAMERYAPEFTLHATTEEAVRRVREALHGDQEVQIHEGVHVTFTKLPPAMQTLVGERLDGAVTIGPVKNASSRLLASWDARIRAVTDVGTAELDVTFHPLTKAPEGWEHAFSATRGGLTATAAFRRTADAGQIGWRLSYTRDDSPAQEQSAALKLLRALSGTGQFVVADRANSGRPELRTPASSLIVFDGPTQALLELFEDVSVIETWTEHALPLPDEIPLEQVRAIAEVAHLIRHRGRHITWHGSELTVKTGHTDMLRHGGRLRIERAVETNLLEQTLDLGFMRFQPSQFRVASIDPVPERPDFVSVRLEPTSPAAARTFELLTRKRTSDHRPPPPPPRRKHRRKKRR